MATYVAFLRAINLGARRKFPKQDIVAGRAVHLLVGADYHSTRLTNAQVERHLGVPTNRNATVIRAVADRWCRA